MISAMGTEALKNVAGSAPRPSTHRERPEDHPALRCISAPSAQTTNLCASARTSRRQSPHSRRIGSRGGAETRRRFFQEGVARAATIGPYFRKRLKGLRSPEAQHLRVSASPREPILHTAAYDDGLGCSREGAKMTRLIRIDLSSQVAVTTMRTCLKVLRSPKLHDLRAFAPSRDHSTFDDPGWLGTQTWHRIPG